MEDLKSKPSNSIPLQQKNNNAQSNGNGKFQADNMIPSANMNSKDKEKHHHHHHEEKKEDEVKKLQEKLDKVTKEKEKAIEAKEVSLLFRLYSLF